VIDRIGAAIAASIAILGLTLSAAAPALADKANPDWPCVQRKVLKLTSAQIWDGPPVDGVTAWRDDAEVTTLVKQLNNRRVPIENAKSAIETYVKTLPKENIDAKLMLVFAGFLTQTNEVRSTVLEGIERFQKRQAARAAEVERQGIEIAKLVENAKDEKDQAALAQAQEKFDWDSRVFTERQQNLPMACEIPILIEQRAFEIGRFLRAHMTS